MVIQQEEFLEEDEEDKMDVFYNALLHSFIINTPNIASMTEDEEFEAFAKYANDDIIKPLGKYTEAFKKYLIENEEGEGFKN